MSERCIFISNLGRIPFESNWHLKCGARCVDSPDVASQQPPSPHTPHHTVSRNDADHVLPLLILLLLQLRLQRAPNDGERGSSSMSSSSRSDIPAVLSRSHSFLSQTNCIGSALNLCQIPFALGNSRTCLSGHLFRASLVLCQTSCSNIKGQLDQGQLDQC